MENTETKEIRINAEYLRLAQLFSSKDDVRYYLKGVQVEPHPSGEGILIIATDGHVLGSFYDRNGYVPEPMLIGFDKGLISALKSERSEKFGRVVTVRGGRTTVMTIDSEGEPWKEKYIKPGNIEMDGTFPDWRRVLPSDVENCNPTFDVSLLKPFEAVCKFFSVKGLKLEPSGETGPMGVKVKGTDDFYGVLMSFNGHAVISNTGKPDWIE